jgi:hypothetical protein
LKANRDVGGGFRPFVFDVRLAQHDVAVAAPFAPVAVLLGVRPALIW